MNQLNFLKKYWLRAFIATFLSFVLVNQVYADVNGEYLVGLNITANGIEIKTGNLTVDTPGTLIMSGATGPTPVAGGGNFAALAVNGTPVSVGNAATPTPASTATPFPTCATGVITTGNGSVGLSCGSSALTTATPAAGTYPYDSLGGAGSILSYATVLPTSTPRPTDTPIPPVATATPQTIPTVNPEQYFSSTSGLASLNATRYFLFGGGYNTSLGSSDASFNGGLISVDASAVTLTKMAAKVDTAPGSAQSIAITLRKNAADTTLTCTISGTSSTTCSTSLVSVTLAAGDLLDWKIVVSATSASNNLAVSAGN